jgi:hypothetical protein
LGFEPIDDRGTIVDERPATREPRPPRGAVIAESGAHRIISELGERQRSRLDRSRRKIGTVVRLGLYRPRPDLGHDGRDRSFRGLVVFFSFP